MGENVEAEVRRLLRELTAAAALRGGMDRAIYDALVAASAALTIGGSLEEQSARKAALMAARARLQACVVEPAAIAA